MYTMKLDIEIYDITEDTWAQAKYLVHLHDDVLWTDSIEDAVTTLKNDLMKIEQEEYYA